MSVEHFKQDYKNANEIFPPLIEDITQSTLPVRKRRKGKERL